MGLVVEVCEEIERLLDLAQDSTILSGVVDEMDALVERYDENVIHGEFLQSLKSFVESIDEVL